MLLCRYGVGSRFKLKHTRAIVNAIHSGVLGDAEYQQTPIFDLHVSARLLLQKRQQQLAILAAECLASVGERRHRQLATVAAKLSWVLCGLGTPSWPLAVRHGASGADTQPYSSATFTVSGISIWCICL